MSIRDPYEDYLPHCLHCDGRHDPRTQSCGDFKATMNKRKAAFEKHMVKKWGADWRKILLGAADETSGGSNPGIDLKKAG